MRKKTYFEEFNIEAGDNMYGEYILVKDQKTDKIVGSVYYAPVPNNNGTSIFYIGYGDKLHPEQNKEEIEEIKSKYPKVGVELFKWVRRNLPEPYYAAFANQDLKRALRAEPTGMEGFDIITGEPITIDIIRRSKKGNKVSSRNKELLEEVKRAIQEGNNEQYSDSMSAFWESIEPGWGKKYMDKYHGPQKSKQEMDAWAQKELKKRNASTKTSVNLTPPESVRAAARRGIKYHSEGKAGDGFESATLTRAKKIADGQELTPEHVKRMHSFFERHAGGRSEKAKKGEVTPWDVAWLAWGGNAGRSWAASKVKELENAKTSGANSNYRNTSQEIKRAVEQRDFGKAERILRDFKNNLGGLHNTDAKEINGILQTIKDLQKYIQRSKESKAKNKCNCWDGYKRVPGTKPCAPGSCEKCDSDRKKKKNK